MNNFLGLLSILLLSTSTPACARHLYTGATASEQPKVSTEIRPSLTLGLRSGFLNHEVNAEYGLKPNQSLVLSAGFGTVFAMEARHFKDPPGDQKFWSIDFWRSFYLNAEYRHYARHEAKPFAEAPYTNSGLYYGLKLRINTPEIYGTFYNNNPERTLHRESYKMAIIGGWQKEISSQKVLVVDINVGWGINASYALRYIEPAASANVRIGVNLLKLLPKNKNSIENS